MPKKSLTSFFEEFLTEESLFVDRTVLLPSFMPETISHRDDEVNQIANILAPALKQQRPSNLFVYGNTGTGKTLTVNYVIKNMGTIAQEKKIPLTSIYCNCKLKRVADTEYRLVAQLASHFGKTIPSTGLPTDEVYKLFYDGLEKRTGIVLIILDEIDQLIRKTGDNILYNLTRINEQLKETQIAIIGISNNTTFMDDVDMRVKSSLSEEDIFFSPYNALMMQSILKQRSGKTFRKDSVSSGVIEKCAAYAAREHGDARKAIELLRVAGELAERSKSPKLTLDHIDEAEQKLEKDKLFDIIRTQPKQFQAVLFSIVGHNQRDVTITGEIYDRYKKTCFKTGLRPLTQRRVSDIIKEFELMGILAVKNISKGRYGRTREVTAAFSSSNTPLLRKVLEEELSLS